MCQHHVTVHVCGSHRSSCLTCSNKRSINPEQKEKHMKVRSLQSAVSATKIPHPWLNVFPSTCFCSSDSDNNYVYSYFIFASHLLVSEYHVCIIYVELLYLLLYIAIFTFLFYACLCAYTQDFICIYLAYCFLLRFLDYLKLILNSQYHRLEGPHLPLIIPLQELELFSITAFINSIEVRHLNIQTQFTWISILIPHLPLPQSQSHEPYRLLSDPLCPTEIDHCGHGESGLVLWSLPDLALPAIPQVSDTPRYLGIQGHPGILEAQDKCFQVTLKSPVHPGLFPLSRRPWEVDYIPAQPQELATQWRT